MLPPNSSDTLNGLQRLNVVPSIDGRPCVMFAVNDRSVEPAGAAWTLVAATGETVRGPSPGGDYARRAALPRDDPNWLPDVSTWSLGPLPPIRANEPPADR